MTTRSDSRQPAAERTSGEVAQTLDRGLQVLLQLGESPDGLSATEVAASLGVHRSIAARLLTTLHRRSFVERRPDGRYALGVGLFGLARRVSRDLVAAATPILSDAAERLRANAVLHLRDGDEAVTMLSIDPPTANFRVGMREGARTPLALAAHGIAILAGDPPAPGDPDEVVLARERGYAVTTGRVVPGYTGISAALRPRGGSASAGLVVPADRGEELSELADEVLAMVRRLDSVLG